jgi:hypothetical protein
VQDFSNPPGADKNDNLGGLILLDGVAWFTEQPNKGKYTLACHTYYSTFLYNTNRELYNLATYMHQKAKVADVFSP